jgi:CheY-like chemotaxis protein
MDVVAAALDRLRGQIEVHSAEGRGTTVRLCIPLRSGIEHAMVVRSDGQMFALPMQCVHAAHVGKQKSAAGTEGERNGARSSGRQMASAQSTPPNDLAQVRLRDLLLLDRSPRVANEQSLIVGLGQPGGLAKSAGRGDLESAGPANRVGLAVDTVVGPEEVVVRSLPPLLRRHRLFAGVTLSGAGEIMLLCDSRRLVELALRKAVSADKADEADSRSAEAASTATARVLVVDDSLSARRSIRRILESCGVEAVECSDGLEALDQLRRETFSLVLSDMEMPRLGGIELLGEIKRGRRTRDLPVVLVTSSNDHTDRTRADDLGADGYIVKPIHREALAEILARFGFNVARSARPQFHPVEEEAIA